MTGPSARRGAVLLATTLLASGEARGDPFVVSTTAGVVLDDNIFRLPARLTPNDGKRRSDTILQGQLRGHYDTLIGLQGITIDASATRYEFLTHKTLSFTGLAITGTWNWKLDSRFSGSAGYDLQRRQTTFAEFRSQGRNIVTVKQPFFEGRYQPGATLFAYGSFRHIDATNSSPSLDPADYSSDVAGGGVGYALRNQGEIRLGVKRTDTHFPNNQFVIVGTTILPVRNDFRLDEAEANILYPLGPKTTLAGRVAYSDRKVQDLSQRDFTGITGRLALDYRPSPLWSFELSARQELTGADDIYTNFVTSRAVAGYAEYHLRDWWSLRLEGETARRTYEGLPIVAPTIGREDHNRYAALSTSYAWRLGSRLDLSVRRETRNSSISQLDYHDTTGTATLTLAFGSPQVVR